MSGRVFVQDSGTGTDEQDSDWLDAANLMALAYDPNTTGVVADGLELTPDFAGDEVSVSSGQANLEVQDVSTVDHSEEPVRPVDAVEWPLGKAVVLIDAASVAIDAAGQTELWLDVDLEAADPDQVDVVAGEPAEEPKLQIGTVDADAETVDALNRKPDGSFGALSADQEFIDPTGTSYTDFSTLGGVTYTQASEPSDPEVGDTWYDTSTGIYRAYADLGSGLKWHPIPPVQVTEEASTFDESDVTVTHNSTESASGSLRLFDGLTTDRPDDDGSYGTTSRGEGLEFSPNLSLSGIEVQISANTGTVSEVFIVDSNKTMLASEAGSFAAGDSVQVSADLNSGETYYVGVYNGGNSYDSGEYSSPSFPYQGDDLDITASGYDLHPDDGSSISTYTNAVRTITQISGLPETSGNALIEWDSGVPDDIESWDLATYQATEDGETVTVDVESISEIDLPLSNTQSDDSEAGIVIDPNYDVSRITAQLGTNVGSFTTAYLIRQSDSTELASKDISNLSGGDKIVFNEPLTAGEEYRVTIDADGESYGQMWESGVDYPFESAFIDIVSGYNDGTDSDLVMNITSVAAADKISDIGRNFDISTISSDLDVALRANLQRDDTSNNPTLDYAARRFTR